MGTSSKRLEGKTVLVTGASQGLGEAVAKAYAKEGARLVLLGRNKKRLEKVYDEVTKIGGEEPWAMSFDLYGSKEEDFATFARQILGETKELDGIVHCASYLYALSPLEFQNIDEWMDQYKVNVVAPMALTKHFLAALLRSKDASVIFVNEEHSVAPKAYWSSFGASCAAKNYLMSTLADEFERFPDVRFNTLIPGPIASPQRRKTHPGEGFESQHPLESVMEDFIYWMSPESKGKTGQTVIIHNAPIPGKEEG